MAVSDEQIKKEIVDRLCRDGRLDAAAVQVGVSKGCVTLSGTVPSYTARQAATDQVGVTPGVVAIRNDVRVAYPVVDDIPADGEIKERVEKLLEWNASVDHGDIRVAVSRGVAVLEGSVDSLWKKLRCERLAADVTGVIEVANKLAVAPRESVADKQLAETVVKALDRSPYVDANKIDVEAAGGEVRLSGSVPAWAGLTAARRAASFARGARDVVTDLRLEGGDI
jgi:osmotically-inducible protein OsmY